MIIYHDNIVVVSHHQVILFDRVLLFFMSNYTKVTT